MKRIDLQCPDDAWPSGLTGWVVIGITMASANDAAWLAFEVADRNVSSTYGSISPGRDMPDEISALDPVIFAVGPRTIWEWAHTDQKEFYRQVAKGQLHIGGDFREFARITPRLIRLFETAGVWAKLDDIIARLHD